MEAEPAAASQRAQARAFLDRFVAAFAAFDGTRVAELFATPCIALRSNGELAVFATGADVAEYYQAALDGYRRDACRSARWSECAVTPMGRDAMLVTATWELLDGDGRARRRWRQSYNLRSGAEDAAAFASAVHAN